MLKIENFNYRKSTLIEKRSSKIKRLVQIIQRLNRINSIQPLQKKEIYKERKGSPMDKIKPRMNLITLGLY